MSVNFNPRLGRLDIALVLGVLVCISPLALVGLNVLRPSANNTPWAIRTAFLCALAVLFARGKFFGPPEPGQKIIDGPRGLLGLVVIGVGGTLIALGALVLLAMSTDARLSLELLWLTAPLSIVALGSAIVVTGARVRNGATHRSQQVPREPR